MAASPDDEAWGVSSERRSHTAHAHEHLLETTPNWCRLEASLRHIRSTNACNGGNKPGARMKLRKKATTNEAIERSWHVPGSTWWRVNESTDHGWNPARYETVIG